MESGGSGHGTPTMTGTAAKRIPNAEERGKRSEGEWW